MIGELAAEFGGMLFPSSFWFWKKGGKEDRNKRNQLSELFDGGIERGGKKRCPSAFLDE